jgi:hypothetical protein
MQKGSPIYVDGSFKGLPKPKNEMVEVLPPSFIVLVIRA